MALPPTFSQSRAAARPSSRRCESPEIPPLKSREQFSLGWAAYTTARSARTIGELALTQEESRDVRATCLSVHANAPTTQNGPEGFQETLEADAPRRGIRLGWRSHEQRQGFRHRCHHASQRVSRGRVGRVG